MMANESMRERIDKERAERERIEASKSLREKLIDRQEDLKRHHAEGKQKLQRLDEQRTELQTTQARIEGALTVLAEEIAKLDQQAS